MTMYNLTSQTNLTAKNHLTTKNLAPKSYILVGLFAVALIATATPALAKDYHDGKHKTYSSYHTHHKYAYDKHSYRHSYKHPYKHSYNHGHVHKGRHKDDHKKYKKHYKNKKYYSTHYRRHSAYHYRRNGYDRYYYKHGHGYKYRHHHKHGHSHRSHSHYHKNYVDDYFAILGGTILVNELLYHSHGHR